MDRLSDLHRLDRLLKRSGDDAARASGLIFLAEARKRVRRFDIENVINLLGRALGDAQKALELWPKEKG